MNGTDAANGMGAVNGATAVNGTRAANGTGRRAGETRAEGKGRAREKAALAEMCSVRLGETLFGVPIRHIVEIVGNSRPQPVPLAPSYVGGLVHYRGDVLTTVSLRNLLGLPPIEEPQDILVLDSCAGGCFGLLVDSVGEVLTVSSADFEPNPAILDERRRAFFGGAYKLKNSLMVLLDPEQMDPIRLSEAAA